MKRAATIVGIPLALMLAFGGCTPTPDANTFSQGEANTVMPVQFGTVTAIRPVEIRPGQTRVGAIAGAVLGGAAGSQIGSSTAANVAGATAGAVAGGAAGSAIQGSSRTAGVELTVELDSGGGTVAIVQPGNPAEYRVGDRVRVTGTADRARVTR